MFTKLIIIQQMFLDISSNKLCLLKSEFKGTTRWKTLIFALTTITITHGIVLKQPVWDVIHISLEIWKVRAEIHLRLQVKNNSYRAYYNETHACAATILQRTSITTSNKNPSKADTSSQTGGNGVFTKPSILLRQQRLQFWMSLHLT
jgi:hypothetical protein